MEKRSIKIKSAGRDLILNEDNKTKMEILPFVTQCQLSVSNLRQKTLVKKWHPTQNQLSTVTWSSEIQRKTGTNCLFQERTIHKGFASNNKHIKGQQN